MELDAALRQIAEQARDHRVERLLEIVVADPVLEEVAQDIERVGRARLLLEEAHEALVRFRPLLGEVQVGDEKRGHYFLAGEDDTSVADSMSTAWRGTSLGKGPPGPVGVLAIFVTTSSPEITLPKAV